MHNVRSYTISRDAGSMTLKNKTRSNLEQHDFLDLRRQRLEEGLVEVVAIVFVVVSQRLGDGRHLIPKAGLILKIGTKRGGAEEKCTLDVADDRLLRFSNAPYLNTRSLSKSPACLTFPAAFSMA